SAIIINQPDSFYRDHKHIVWLTLGFFALLSSVIFVLTLAVRRQKRAEKKLLQLQKTLEEKVADRTRELHTAMETAEKTSRELKVTSTEMQSILDNSPIGIVFTTSDRIIRQVNAEIIKISGYTLDEILGKTARDIFMSEQAFKKFGEKAYPALMRQQTVESRIQLKKKDGTPVWCNVRGRLISQGDDTRGIIWILSDISERIAAEEERRTIARELEQAQRYKSLNVMAGAIAHHYNNIMTSVQGNIELLLMGLPESSQVRRLAINALNSAQKASRMSTSMLVYVGQQKVDPMALDLGILINDLRELLKNNVRAGTEIILEQEKVPLVCEADPAQIRELILNLVINADESIPGEGGRITIWTSTACVRGLDQPTPFRDVELSAENYICCQITDNGTGMDKETFDHMFEPFFSTKFTGRGLGLSIVAGILKAHHGTMEVKSSPDEGTVIRFYLPAAPLINEKPSAVAGTTGPGKHLPQYSGMVIFADDHLEASRIGESQLHRMGFEVLLASNGQEAIDLYRHHGRQVSLVFLDAVMPTVSGTEALERIRKIDPAARIILVSGYSKDQIEPDLSAARPDVFLQKPYKMDQLVDAVARIMEL
ncbi:MAG: ATP-binding protein, partial [Desulfobacterales bacterium]|nr:ATP-binding protein [Desulfobacterales bacterium]